MSANEKALKYRIVSVLKNIGRPASIKEISGEISDKPVTTIRGRINENVNKLFKRVARGVYWFVSEEETSGVMLLEGNGLDMSYIEDESVDAIITDHPWLDPKSNKGTNRKFDNSYDTFLYKLEDFKEKARVLKNGSFLVEILPAENENNYKYLYKIKEMAEECGLLYYAKVPWRKGNLIFNTGRKSKNTEDIMFFTKGKARALRPDQSKRKRLGGEHYMSGAAGMLPTDFETEMEMDLKEVSEIDAQPASNRNKIHQAEKPIELYQQIINFVTKPGEIVLDQFAGSGNLGAAALLTNRFAFLIEKLNENVQKICKRLNHFAKKDQVVYQLNA
ncbi:DNA methyltransferase [Priestia aryabhattai]|uniref:DNA methyltransferase n=1 Tax=Priestia aryabhattai TaxID=412384 RepID=A0AAX6NDQ2_PRIAR|nr:DNA methyltransferase [Priestia aryabhattai]MDU9693917.1 DNA methyltransferase [Priestia aryabhattai]